MQNDPAAPPLSGQKRAVFFDFVRGFSILSMVGYHLCYDLTALFGISLPWFYQLAGMLWQQSICLSFIFIAGACCFFSRSNLRRGVRLFLLGMGFTVVTTFALPGAPIRFGLLHFLGVCVLLYGLLAKMLGRWAEKIPAGLGLAGCWVLFYLFRWTPQGVVGITLPLNSWDFVSIWTVSLPSWLYETSFLFPLGFPGPGFTSSDYFPLLPYGFVFAAGLFLGKLAKQGCLPAWVWRDPFPPLSWLGRHSMAVYLLHQPILLALVWLGVRLLG